MPYCPNCGKEVQSDINFCPICGTRLLILTPPPPPTQPPTPTSTQITPVNYPMKNEGITALLAGLVGLFLLGIGHFYVGKIGTGIAFLILGLVLDGFALGLFIMNPIAALTPTVMAIFAWAYSIFDAYNLAKQYNRHLRATGQPPW